MVDNPDRAKSHKIRRLPHNRGKKGEAWTTESTYTRTNTDTAAQTPSTAIHKERGGGGRKHTQKMKQTMESTSKFTASKKGASQSKRSRKREREYAHG